MALPPEESAVGLRGRDAAVAAATAAAGVGGGWTGGARVDGIAGTNNPGTGLTAAAAAAAAPPPLVRNRTAPAGRTGLSGRDRRGSADGVLARARAMLEKREGGHKGSS